MRTYLIVSTQKSNTSEAYQTAKAIIEALDIPLEIPVQTASCSSKRQGVGIEWDSVAQYTLSNFVLIIHVYMNVKNVDLDLPFLTTIDCPTTNWMT